MAITYPVAPVVRPADLTGQWNGRLDAGLLRTVEGGGRLHHLAARAWAALVTAAAAAGHELTYTHGGTYRTYEQQETLFRSRYEVGGPGGGCKLWNGQRWCKKSPGLATAAVPGTSNHGLGLAVDMAEDHDLTDGRNPGDAVGLDTATLTWLVANAPRFGWSWETVPEEPWHIRYVAGDAIPQAVLEHELPTNPDTPSPSVEVDMIILHRKRGTDQWDAMVQAGTSLSGVRSEWHLNQLRAAGVREFDVPDDAEMDRIIATGVTTNDCPPSMALVPSLKASWDARRVATQP